MSRVEADRHRRVAEVAETWARALVPPAGPAGERLAGALGSELLDLTAADPDALAELLGGRPVSLARLAPGGDPADTRRRAGALHQTAADLAAGRGLETLFLACGVASWPGEPGTGTLPVPVVLRRARLRPDGPGHEDYDLTLVGDARVNPELDLRLGAAGCPLDEGSDLLAEGRGETLEGLREALRRVAAGAALAPGFAVAPHLVLGCFTAPALDAAAELRASVDALAGDDLAAAAAGDPGARAALGQRRAAEPRGGAAAALVLDADADQRAVVDEVLAGRDLIVRGPPGTGKTQTTANLVAALAAQGRSVLVVSGIGAALDAALGRLERLGLRDLALAVRGPETPGDLSRELAQALDPPGPAAVEGEDAELERLRAELDDHVEALHGTRAPWGISAFDAQAIVLGTPTGARSRVRLGGDAIAGLNAGTLPAVEDSVRRYAELGGLARGAGAGHWSRARIEGEEEAARALALVTRLDRETLPAARSAMERASREVGHELPEAITDWGERIALYEAVGTTLSTVEPAAFSPGLAAALEPLSLSGLARARATVTDPEFRWARRRLRELSLRPETDEGDLYRAVLDARELQEHWQSLVGGASSGAGLLSASPLVAPSHLRELRERYERLQAELAELDALLPQLRLTTRSPEELEAVFGELRDAGPAPTSLPELRRLQAAFRREGLWDLVEDCRTTDRAPEECALAVRFAWANAALAHIGRDTPALARFDGPAHRRTAERYRAAVGRRLERNAAELRRAHVERVAAARTEWAAEAALVEEQAGPGRPSLGLRELAGTAGPLLRALKPCWVMSPSAVGPALPAEPWFDVLVVDEAGRLALGDAAPALLRARQVVLLGDERQLAPAPAAGEPSPASALDALSGVIDERPLGTHYRSRDERLSAFANAHVYEGRLVTFPGVGGSESPLRHVLIRPRKQGDAAADELDAVVRLACEHIDSRPDESLGIIAADAAQAARVREALRARAREDSGIAAFLAEDARRTPLVTTPDGAQGEERDAVILALPAERREATGPVHGVGALGAEGGEHRVCVAATRARRRLTVVSSFRASDMDAAAAESPGGRLVQAFLRDAERGGDEPPAPARHTLDALTDDVQRALADAGVPTEARVGRSRRPVELAASHPTRPGRRVLAVELDGPDYRDEGEAQDRDRIRPEQLERLGWVHHRLWSAEWIENRERAIARVSEAFQRALRAAEAPAPTGTRRRAPAPAPSATAAGPGAAAPAVVVPGREITRYRPEELEEVVRWVRSTARPRDQEELFREVMKVMGFRRRGPRIVRAIETAIEQAGAAEASR